MSYKLRVAGFDDNGRYVRYFYNYLKNLPEPRYSGQSLKLLYDEYNAQFLDSDIVTFESLEDLVMFKLKYG